MEKKERLTLFLCQAKGEHSRLEPQELCPCLTPGERVCVRTLVHTRTCTPTHTLSCIWLFATPWTLPHEAPLSMGFSRQEYWSGLPFPSPGALPNPGIKSVSPALQVMSLLLGHLGSPPLGNRERICSQAFLLCSLGSRWAKNFQMYKLDLEMAEEP